MKDLLSPEVEIWQRIEAVAREHFGLYHYKEIRVPLLEDTSLFTRGIGEETGVVKKEMYTFNDKGDESVTLRPEGTASVVRAFIEHNLQAQDPTHKLYYFGPMFRYERPQKGRLRQFHQIGAELFGPSNHLADVDMISMLDGLVRKLGVTTFDLELNSLGCKNCRPPYEKKFSEFLKSIHSSLCTDCHRRLENNPLRVFDCKNEACQKALKDAPVMLDDLCGECKPHFDGVRKGLEGASVPFVVNPRIARGLDYYQRTAFELKSSSLGAQNAFAGGGRYDGLVEDLGGPSVPGIGFAIGVERLVLLMQPPSADVRAKKIYVAFMGGTGHCKAIGICRELRRAGLVCDMDFEEKSLKSQLRRADKLGFSHVIILGDNEVSKGVAQVKDLVGQKQEEVPLGDLVKHFGSM